MNQPTDPLADTAPRRRRPGPNGPNTAVRDQHPCSKCGAKLWQHPRCRKCDRFIWCTDPVRLPGGDQLPVHRSCEVVTGGRTA
jgi:hypothetical protein